MGKIVSKEEFKKTIRPELKEQGKTIVLCHGVFDLVHPGHINHFEQAKKMGDVLVVSITSASYVRKGPGRPYFNDEQRLHFLSALKDIDYVLLSEGYTVDDIIENVEPDIYVKGSEYANEEADLTGKIREERLLVEKHGGRIQYTGGEVYSSTNLINRGLSGMTDELRAYMTDFGKTHSMQELLDAAGRMETLKILVIGDIIFDRYTYCTVNGLMSKDIGYAARLQSSEEYLGGSLAVARHLSSFSNNVTLASVIGEEPGMENRIRNEISSEIRLELLISPAYSTIVKHRYLMRNEKREEYKKIFAINNIPEIPGIIKETADAFRNRLLSLLEENDVVFVCDFGHGLLDSETISLIEKNAKLLVLNCQTNSSNYGMNLITKYHRADAFTLNQKELKLAFPELMSDEDQALEKLKNHLHAKTAYLTRGSRGAVCLFETGKMACPAFSLSVKDTVGAGDAFFSVGGACAAVEASPELGLFVGNIAGALESNIIGNKEAVDKVNVLKYAATLFNV